MLETVTGDSPAEAGAVSEHTLGALLMHIGPGAVESVPLVEHVAAWSQQ